MFFVSGGSEAMEACLKMARQYATAKGEGSRYKVIALMPSFHDSTLGALVTSAHVIDTIDAVGAWGHGHTYGGSPLAAAAGLAVMKEVDDGDLVINAERMGRASRRGWTVSRAISRSSATCAAGVCSSPSIWSRTGRRPSPSPMRSWRSGDPWRSASSAA